jgi:hypothetical protein
MTITSPAEDEEDEDEEGDDGTSFGAKVRAAMRLCDSKLRRSAATASSSPIDDMKMAADLGAGVLAATPNEVMEERPN